MMYYFDMDRLSRLRYVCVLSAWCAVENVSAVSVNSLVVCLYFAYRPSLSDLRPMRDTSLPLCYYMSEL